MMRATFQRRFAGWDSLPVILCLVPSAVILYLLLFAIWQSFRTTVPGGEFTLEHYAVILGDSLVYEAIFNTSIFAVVTLVVSVSIGTAIAWLVERTDFGAPRFVQAVMTIGVLIPGFITAIGWLFLLHPRSGIANRLLMDLFGLSEPPLSIVSPAGMGIIQGLGLAPLVFVVMAGAVRAIDHSLEECAYASGAGLLKTFQKITLPLLKPALLAASLYVFIIAISAFDVPAVIGLSNRIFTFSTFLYLRVSSTDGVPEYGIAGAFSTFMILIGLVLTWWYSRVTAARHRYQVVTGKGYRTHLISLGRWRVVAWAFVLLYVGLALALPVILLLWTALLPYLQPPSARAMELLSFDNFKVLPWPMIKTGVSRTLVLVIMVPTLAMLVSLLFSWVVLRSRSRFKLFFEGVAFLPHAVPNIILAVSALMAALYLSVGIVDIYGSVVVLITVLALAHVSFGTRVTNSALIQIHQELEEAALLSGASQLTSFRRIVLPLIMPAIMYGWLWLALLAFRELTISAILSFPPSNLTLPVVIFTLFNGGETGIASAVSLMMIVGMAPFVILYLQLMRRWDTRNLRVS